MSNRIFRPDQPANVPIVMYQGGNAAAAHLVEADAAGIRKVHVFGGYDKLSDAALRIAAGMAGTLQAGLPADHVDDLRPVARRAAQLALLVLMEAHALGAQMAAEQEAAAKRVNGRPLEP